MYGVCVCVYGHMTPPRFSSLLSLSCHTIYSRLACLALANCYLTSASNFDVRHHQEDSMPSPPLEVLSSGDLTPTASTFVRWTLTWAISLTLTYCFPHFFFCFNCICPHFISLSFQKTFILLNYVKILSTYFSCSCKNFTCHIS